MGPNAVAVRPRGVARFPFVRVVAGAWVLALGLLGCGRTSLYSAEDRAGSGAASLGELEGESAGGVQTCREVDFLFVVDNSGSMRDNQAKLVANYDVFIDGIVETIDRLESIHVGVVTTDAYASNLYPCNELGGLVLNTGGKDSSNRKCGPYADGDNFMTEADNLDVKFRCAARVGTEGSGKESSLQAAISAVTPPMTQPGGCNEGFVRDGALLVLVIISDEDVDIDPLFAAGSLVEAKHGDLDSIVVVGLANPETGECGEVFDEQIARGLTGFAASFPHGFVGPICASDYSEVFAQAVDVVRGACPSD